MNWKKDWQRIFENMKLLYITRKYPPMVGGMEKTSYDLAHEFSKRIDTTLITWGKSQKYLPFILLLFLIKALYIIPSKKITHVHIGDALLSPLGLVLKKIYNVKTSITIHGLDIIFNFPGYQLLVPKCVTRLDSIICVSNATLEECLKRGIPKNKLTVINWGVYPEKWIVKATRKDLEKIVGQKLEGKKVLITVGRLVKRKGVYWFIENVMPKLNENIIYLVIGEGTLKFEIEEQIKEKDLQKRVLLLGKISDEQLKIIYNTADLFIMPNIKDNKSFEGFGIVAIEASSTGLPVISSRLEGITNAVINNKSGQLINPMDEIGFVESINTHKFNKTTIINSIKEYFSWDIIATKYVKTISSM